MIFFADKCYRLSVRDSTLSGDVIGTRAAYNIINKTIIILTSVAEAYPVESRRFDTCRAVFDVTVAGDLVINTQGRDVVMRINSALDACRNALLMAEAIVSSRYASLQGSVTVAAAAA